LGAVIFANFFVLTLYVQQVLGWSALKTGVTFLATAGTTVFFAGLAQALVTRFGARAVMSVGLLLLAAALAFYTRIPVRGGYAANLQPGYLLFAGGLAFSFVPVSIAALAGIQAHEAGLASGLINTNQQVGGAVGVAIASTIVTSRFNTLVHSGHPQPVALTDGFHAAFWLLTGIAIVAAAVALAFVRVRRPESIAVSEPAEATTP
ncbi:MAG: MFS transporter, partial [Gaiellaceae bacterium]